MKDTPVPLVLDLWSLGHSGADIAGKLGFPSFKVIERIVLNARSIGDQRAVYHFTGDRILGKAIPAKEREVRFRTSYRGFPLVPRLLAVFCLNGHPRNAETVYESGRCSICRKEKYGRTGR